MTGEIKKDILFVNITPGQDVSLLVPRALLRRDKVILHGQDRVSQNCFEKMICLFGYYKGAREPETLDY